MPQLNPEFFVSQLFWLVVTFSFLFVFLWRVSLPRIGNVLEKRERKITEDLTAAKELQAEASQIQEEIEKQLKKTYKFLLKMDELQSVQKELIRFLRSLTDIYPSDLKQAFRKLHASLKNFENDPYEKRSFLYLDILSWLESKIENRSIGEIIREKASLLIR